MARGIAFQLVENLGVLERRAVLEEVRGLSQDERALLRRHGVRFGAYHIYIPNLLKPAPSALAALLWALKHRDLAASGLAEMQSVSGSGRTSAPVDPAIDQELYRRFGFRIYGTRAIRLDILERLADLIRPALAWRPATSAERPAGALPAGGGFTVTPAMTSLLGASGEDLSGILRGLGYRMERLPKPVEPPVETIPAETPPAMASEIEAGMDAPSVSAPEPNAQSETGAAPVEVPAGAEPAVPEPTAVEPTVEMQAADQSVEPQAAKPASPEPTAEEQPADEPTAEVVASDEAVAADEAVAREIGTAPEAEPEMIEVWRIGRPPREQRRPRGRTQRDSEQRGGEQRSEDGREKRQRFAKRQQGDANARRERPDRDGANRDGPNRAQAEAREEPWRRDAAR